MLIKRTTRTETPFLSEKLNVVCNSVRAFRQTDHRKPILLVDVPQVAQAPFMSAFNSQIGNYSFLVKILEERTYHVLVYLLILTYLYNTRSGQIHIQIVKYHDPSPTCCFI
jgi:hypothetical protein